jgi:uncharacterized protein
MVEMHLAAVKIELPSNNPVVLLQEVEGARRTLPIFVGPFEANAIAEALQGVVRERPMTHDLLRDVVGALGGRLARIVVTELRNRTFFAELHIEIGGRTEVVSSRPSDAIALAARAGAPIFADDDLMDSESVVLEDDDPADPDPELVDEFKSFIEGVRPEDFAG